MLDHRGAQLCTLLAELLQGEIDVPLQTRVHARHLLPVAALELLPKRPAYVRAQLATQPPQVHWIEPAERLHAVLLQRLADRLEELPAMLLDQRFEERHAEHLALALVDARGEEHVDVVAQRMAL